LKSPPKSHPARRGRSGLRAGRPDLARSDKGFAGLHRGSRGARRCAVATRRARSVSIVIAKPDWAGAHETLAGLYFSSGDLENALAEVNAAHLSRALGTEARRGRRHKESPELLLALVESRGAGKTHEPRIVWLQPATGSPRRNCGGNVASTLPYSTESRLSHKLIHSLSTTDIFIDALTTRSNPYNQCARRSPVPRR
jgi:hypothetical protein